MMKSGSVSKLLKDLKIAVFFKAMCFRVSNQKHNTHKDGGRPELWTRLHRSRGLLEGLLRRDFVLRKGTDLVLISQKCVCFLSWLLAKKDTKLFIRLKKKYI